MKKNKRNAHLKNSKGISSHEFKLGSEAAPYAVREDFKDYDYLNKLSPEELAWLAEFNANEYQGFEADPDIVGEESSEKMNSQENRRKAYRRKNFKQNNSPFTTRHKQSMDSEIYRESGTTLHELIINDNYLNAIEEADEAIDAYWREKNEDYKD